MLQIRTALVSMIVTVFVACASDDQAPEEADALLAQVRAENYRAWARAPGYEQRRNAASPHAEEVDIYVNGVVAKALADAKPLAEWPEGSVIVKDGWDGSDLELIAVMQKRADGWFWAEFFDDESKYSGKPSVCIDCHASGADSVRAFPLPK
jgi:hypothetical protein